MTTVTLVTCRDPSDGSTGFVPDGMIVESGGLVPAQTGEALAHDLLEHVNGVGAIGGVPDELEAVGAIWQIRGRHGDQANGPRVGLVNTASLTLVVADLIQDTDEDGYWPGATPIAAELEHEPGLARRSPQTTLEDRWRQILNEANRVPRKHLLTLQGINERNRTGKRLLTFLNRYLCNKHQKS